MFPWSRACSCKAAYLRAYDGLTKTDIEAEPATRRTSLVSSRADGMFGSFQNLVLQVRLGKKGRGSQKDLKSGGSEG